MSLWEFYALVDGYIEANSSKEDRIKAPSSDDHDRAVEWFKRARKHVGDTWAGVKPVGKLPSHGLESTDAVLAQLSR